MRRLLVAAAFAAAAFPVASASAYCEVPLGSKCLVPSVCGAVIKPVHTVDDALGAPLHGIPHCID
jgi:hypothetical protein